MRIVGSTERVFQRLPVTLFAAFLLALVPAASAPRAEASPAAPPSYTTAMFKLAHPGGLRKYVGAVTTPGSKRYRQYRSVKWAVERFGARSSVKKRALGWLAARGIDGEVDAAGRTILADLDRDQTESLLPPGATASSARDGAVAPVPPGLSGAVDSLTILDSDPDKFKAQAKLPPQPAGSPFPADSSARPHSGTASGCEGGRTAERAPGLGPFTPNQYVDAYGISDLHDRGLKGQGMKIAVVEIDGFKRSDIERFGRCFGVRIPPTPIRLVGPKQPLRPGAETTLDLSVISAAAPRLKRIDVYQGGSNEAGIMRSVGASLGKPGAKPDAISISLGSCEPWLGGDMQYRRGLDNLFAVAAIAGISVFVAAGDTGSAGCSLDDNQDALPLLAVGDPASSTWVTAVGGTNLVLDADNSTRQEFVWNDGSLGPSAGGGGFSILKSNRRPWYQRSAPFKGAGLTRLVPDVAALADQIPGYSIYCTAKPSCVGPGLPDGGFLSVGGTSAATPLTAAGFTLLAQRDKRAGRAPIGFANPLLYRLGPRKAGRAVFRDIRRGNNDVGEAISADLGGGVPLGCCTAARGFDLASGWGSIEMTGLAKVSAKFGN